MNEPERTPERRLQPSTDLFARNDDVAAQPITRLEGLAGAATGALAVKALLTGQDATLLEIHRKRGRVDPEHVHPDHESLCYLVSGRMRVVINGNEFMAGPGDAWLHPAGVSHYHETLEDSVQIEIKAPPMRTWD